MLSVEAKAIKFAFQKQLRNTMSSVSLSVELEIDATDQLQYLGNEMAIFFLRAAYVQATLAGSRSLFGGSFHF